MIVHSCNYFYCIMAVVADKSGLPSLRLSVESTASQNNHSDYSDASASLPHDSWHDSELEEDHHSDDPEAHERFLQMRKKHYDMKDGLRKGRELTASEAEGNSDDEDDVKNILNS